MLCLICSDSFITSASVYLIADKKNEQLSWDYYFTEADTYTEAEIAASANAAKLTTGTYVERLDSVDIKNSNMLSHSNAGLIGAALTI